jgi:hypothetical protein
MQTFTIEINNDSALKTLHDLEDRHLISIVSQNITDTPALQGKPLSISHFKNWINDAEGVPSVSLEEAKSIWSAKKQQLNKNTR